MDNRKHHFDWLRQHSLGQSMAGMAEEAGVDRTAVWRGIKGLIEEAKEDPLTRLVVDSAIAPAAPYKAVVKTLLTLNQPKTFVAYLLEGFHIFRDGIWHNWLSNDVAASLLYHGLVKRERIGDGTSIAYILTEEGKREAERHTQRHTEATPGCAIGRLGKQGYLTPQELSVAYDLRSMYDHRDADVVSADDWRHLMSDLGPGLSDVVLMVCGFGLGLEEVEKRLEWPARSGKLMLRYALRRYMTKGERLAA